ncbi:cold-shock protein [Saccharospirillum impatiens]|uniref:cold-shock protein n=1 Tax=Saccharospirillum impatiens TaxID=169438 RepID=UPI00041A634B|nr:cold shock domain-containing protein [Saccharospirillum impatiens]
MFLIRVGVALLVALPAPVILAAALILSGVGAEVTLAELTNTRVSGSEWIAFVAVLIVVSVLATLAQYMAQPLLGQAEKDNREEGIVKWFNVSKGFGFITRDNQEDVFVHFRSIRGRGHRSLQEGQRVKFGVVESTKGLQAEDVTVVRQR